MSPEPLPERLSYRTPQWLVAACALLHNLEEAVTMSRFAPQIRERLSGVAPASLLAVTGNLSWFYTALVVAALVPCIVVLNAVMRRMGKPGRRDWTRVPALRATGAADP
jgi:hypothetical protein